MELRWKFSADELHEPLIAHFVGGAFFRDGVLELRCFGQEVNELLLNRAGAGHMHCLRVLHVAGDFLEKLTLQSPLLVMLRVLVGIAVRAGIFDMTDHGEFFRVGAGTTDDGGMMVVHPNAKLLLVIS